MRVLDHAEAVITDDIDEDRQLTVPPGAVR
jgi:hypothetical protein